MKSTTKKSRQPYHRQTHPDGWPCQRACQMQSDRDTRLRTALAGLDGKDLMLKLADELDAYAGEPVDDDLVWFCMNHPTPFQTHVWVFQEAADKVFWWMRTNGLSGQAEGLERLLQKIVAIAKQLDFAKPPAGQPRQERGFARHVPLNCELQELARRLREVAGKAAPDGDEILPTHVVTTQYSVSDRTLRRYMKAGRLKSRRQGDKGEHWFKKADLKHLFDPR